MPTPRRPAGAPQGPPRDLDFPLPPPSTTDAAPVPPGALQGAAPSLLAPVLLACAAGAAAGALPPAAGPALGAALVAALLALFSAHYLPATLFERPHPALWRAVAGAGLAYSCCWAYVLCQPLGAAQALLQGIAGEGQATGTEPLPQRSYAEDCSLSPRNVLAQVDVFVLAHLVGWAGKAFMFRDFWFTMAQSFTFELLEYTFEHLQPNFRECWWDHWVMDFLLCNTAGVLAGHWLMAACGMRQYNWVGAAGAYLGGSRAPSPARAVAAQLALPAWPPSDWLLLRQPRRAAAVAALFALALAVDLNGFFLKHILHVRVGSPLNAARLLLWCLLSTAGLRDWYACLAAPGRGLGVAGWAGMLALVAEAAVVARLGRALPEWQGATMPLGVALAWAGAGAAGAGAALAWFAPRCRAVGREGAVVGAGGAGGGAGARARSASASRRAKRA